MSDAAIPKLSIAATHAPGSKISQGGSRGAFASSPRPASWAWSRIITAGDPSLDATRENRAGRGGSRRGCDRAGRAVQRSGGRRADDSARQRTRAAQRHDARGRDRSGRAGSARTPRFRSCSSATSIRSCRWASRNSPMRRARPGADGVLATDLTPEEAGEYRAVLHARGLDTIFLAAPTSTDARLAKIAECSSGFLYLISRTGVTGDARLRCPRTCRRWRGACGDSRSCRSRSASEFRQPEHVSVLGGIADAAVVGSALVAEIEKAARWTPARLWPKHGAQAHRARRRPPECGAIAADAANLALTCCERLRLRSRCNSR